MEHKIVMAGNLVWSGMALPTFLVFAYALYRRVKEQNCGPTERLMAGVCLVALVGFLHRGYWAAWRFFLDRGENDIAALFVQHGWALTGLIIAVAIGYVLHLKPYLQQFWGKPWLVPIGLYITVLAAIPFFL